MAGSEQPAQQLQRSIGVGGATMLGLGSIVGTGVFVSIGIAAGIGGSTVLLAIALAAVLATCNALSSAQLAASHPVSGGTYEYGYRYLRPWLGFTAGWMFLCAKSASAATAALGFAGYLLHALGFGQTALVPIAAATAIIMTLLVLSGLRRSNRVNTTIVSITVLALLTFIVIGLGATPTASGNLLPLWPSNEPGGTGLPAFLAATALMFVAYTGYGRIATLGEEIHDPARNIPRAVVVTLVVSAALYLGVAAVALHLVGADRLAQLTGEDAAPLELIASEHFPGGVHLLISIGAITAMLGVLLNLILGLSRVLLAMGRRGDMPRATARLDRHGHTPIVAVIVIGVLVTALSCIGSVALTWSFSAVTVLIYYALTNLAALRLPRESRRYPRFIAWAGLVGCLGLAVWIEWRIWLAAAACLLIGWLWHAIAQAQQQRAQS